MESGKAFSHRLHAPELPINHGILADADKLGKLLNHEPPVHPSFPDGLPKRMWFFRIGGIKLDEIEVQFKGVEELRKVVFL